jgi:hypothetical protein
MGYGMIHIILGKIVKIVLYVYIESFCVQYEYAMLNFSFHFPPSTSVSSTNKTERHDSTKTLLKVALIDLSFTNTSSASERLALVLLNYIINELQNSNIDIFNRPCQCDWKQE